MNSERITGNKRAYCAPKFNAAHLSHQPILAQPHHIERTLLAWIEAATANLWS
jgi:hypothetical protein